MVSHARVTCLSNDPMVIFIWRFCVNFNEIPHDFSMIEPSCKWNTSQFYKGYVSYEQLTSWETYRSTWRHLLLWPFGITEVCPNLGEVMASSWDIYEVYGLFVGWFHLKKWGGSQRLKLRQEWNPSSAAKTGPSRTPFTRLVMWKSQESCRCN
jgi:hypothetical protein